MVQDNIRLRKQVVLDKDKFEKQIQDYTESQKQIVSLN